MKILHTADLHIQDDSHIPIVEAVIRTAQSNGAELILIAGDLFDATANFELLNEKLRPIWDSYSGDILLIPGNHDAKFLKNRSSLAANLVVASQEPYSLCEIANLVVLCVPHQQDKAFEEIALPSCEVDILLTHGTFGIQGEGMFPITPEDLATRYRYAALGHYHNWFDKYIDGCMVVNPGSVNQGRRGCRGPRYVALLDSYSWLVKRIELPLSFTEYKTVEISVLDSNAEIEERIFAVTSFLGGHNKALLHLMLKGSTLHGSLEDRIALWSSRLRARGIDTQRITWDYRTLVQIDDEVLYSDFARSMIDKLAADHPVELNKLAPTLLLHLQRQKG